MLKVTRTAILCFCLSLTAVAGGTDRANAQSASEVSATQDWSRYMKSEELAHHLNGQNAIQVIDIRTKKYLKHGVIPGAVWMPFAEWRGPKSRPGQPMKEEALEAMLGSAGLDLSRPFVIHNHSGSTIQTGRAAIVYWTLKSAGAEQLAILQGGYKAWKAADLPQATLHTSLPQSVVDLTFRFDWWADPFDILAISTNQKQGAIIDARLDMQVKKAAETGKPMMSMPLAQYFPAGFFLNQLSAKNLAEAGRSAFRNQLTERGIELDDGMLISVCQTGELSAISWFYASELVGIDNVRYYPDALQGWKSDGGYMFGLKTGL